MDSVAQQRFVLNGSSKQRFMSKLVCERNMNTGIEDSLIFRVETDEFVFEQWDLAVPISQKKAHPETS